ncbi:MAG: MmcQ/YjbR family DNA-binding protein [Pseudomonadota bacterium]
MTRAIVDAFCCALPGAELGDPTSGEHDAWKVGGKMFACIGIENVGVSVKTADIASASFLIELGRAEKAPYFHRSWVRVPWGLAERDELEDRLRTSYEIVRAGLPKKVRDALGD